MLVSIGWLDWDYLNFTSTSTSFHWYDQYNYLKLDQKLPGEPLV